MTQKYLINPYYLTGGYVRVYAHLRDAVLDVEQDDTITVVRDDDVFNSALSVLSYEEAWELYITTWRLDNHLTLTTHFPEVAITHYKGSYTPLELLFIISSKELKTAKDFVRQVEWSCNNRFTLRTPVTVTIHP